MDTGESFDKSGTVMTARAFPGSLLEGGHVADDGVELAAERGIEGIEVGLRCLDRYDEILAQMLYLVELNKTVEILGGIGNIKDRCRRAGGEDEKECEQ